ncbi:MAG: chromosome segregation protein SMC [Planctomycetes bacterium]|nr:chromosome segregation protein SMC [Planctomycetota bacterium]
MTRLTALELFGFKSFADRTRFEFPAGITVVVGPNGSGKSNVVDAIKWVLGEQSVRSLRGKEMTDVIFAGSASRKPLNMAEVSLIFDNSARELPVTTDAVQISRRVYRNGESEYLLNGEPARLRDIRELFSGTGAATEAYSVIEQGRVDALLVASGRDRRAVFEEAAGITRFRSRRTEALRRLERAEQNRQRLADIVGEVSSRLETVRHQAARARRWKTMQDRLRRLRLAAAGRDLAGVDAAIATVDESLELTRRQAAENETTGAELGALAAALARGSDDLQPRLAAARAAAASGQQRLAAAETTEALVRERRGEFDAEVARAGGAVVEARTAERAAAAAVRGAEHDVTAITAALEGLRGALSAREAVAAGTHLDITSARASLAAAAAVVDDLSRRHLRLEAEHERAGVAVQEARTAAAEARSLLTETRGRHAALGESRSACEGHLESLDTRLRGMVAEVEALQAAQREAGEALRKAWTALSGWKATLEACRERRAVLADVVQRHEGVSEAARRLLADEITASIPGLTGVLADMVVAGVEWAPLVDLALGELAQSLVVDSLDEAIGWHAAWAATPAATDVLAAGGRIGFLAARGLREPDAFEPEPHPGLVGRLDRLIADDRPHVIVADVVRRLLGRVWVVERIEHALPSITAAPAGTLFLTREGVSLMAGGGFAVGSPSATTGLVARRSELRALDERHAELARTVADAEREIAVIQQGIEARDADIARGEAARQAAAEQFVSARVDLTRVSRDEHAAREAIARAEDDSRRADQRVVLADGTAETLRRDRDDLAARLEQARADAARCRDAIDAVERDRGAAIDEIQRLRIEEAATAEKRARLEDAAAAAAARLAVRRDEVARAEERLEAATRRAERHVLEVLAASSSRAEACWIAETSAAALADLSAEGRRLDADRQRVAAEVEAARAAATRLAEQLHAFELQAGDARHQRARIMERIRDEYDLDIAALPPEEPAPAEQEPIPDHRDELEARIEELRRKLGGMTSVNLEALRESEELAERLAKLEAQLTDVTGAKESIETLIARIDEESRRLLGETIETVRGHFRDLFERVFGGGQADIVLEEGVDLLDAAVEIVARPPGKEPRGISLLSGGEKTMTCVALLLAIFKSRPSPFCVLDEVDAALDEANVDRFVGVLRDFLSSTQFIVVTHSKKTMASATTLYGVTMEESGVSKRVSVRFESSEAATRTSSRAA